MILPFFLIENMVGHVGPLRNLSKALFEYVTRKKTLYQSLIAALLGGGGLGPLLHLPASHIHQPSKSNFDLICCKISIVEYTLYFWLFPYVSHFEKIK